MSVHAIVNSIGLALDITGAIFLWRYGLPEALSREGHTYIITGEIDAAETAKAKSYDRCAKVGLGLLVAGFFCQLVSNFI